MNEEERELLPEDFIENVKQIVREAEDKISVEQTMTGEWQEAIDGWMDMYNKLNKEIKALDRGLERKKSYANVKRDGRVMEITEDSLFEVLDVEWDDSPFKNKEKSILKYNELKKIAAEEVRANWKEQSKEWWDWFNKEDPDEILFYLEDTHHIKLTKPGEVEKRVQEAVKTAIELLDYMDYTIEVNSRGMINLVDLQEGYLGGEESYKGFKDLAQAIARLESHFDDYIYRPLDEREEAGEKIPADDWDKKMKNFIEDDKSISYLQTKYANKKLKEELCMNEQNYEEAYRINHLNRKDIIVEGEEIEKIFMEIGPEKLESHNIKTLDDFYDYIEAQIKSNIEYDFGISIEVENKTLFDQKMKYDFLNQKDWALDYVESEYGMKLTEEQQNQLAGRLSDAVLDSEFLAETQSEVERQCIEEFICGIEEGQNEKDYAKPKHDCIESNKGVVAEAQVEPVLHKQK